MRLSLNLLVVVLVALLLLGSFGVPAAQPGRVSIPKDAVFIHQYLAPDYWNALVLVNNDPAFPIVSERFFVNGVEVAPDPSSEHMVSITVSRDNPNFRQLTVCWIKHSTGAPFRFGDVVTVVVTDSAGRTVSVALDCIDATVDGEFRCLR